MLNILDIKKGGIMKDNPNYGIGRPITDYVKELEEKVKILEEINFLYGTYDDQIEFTKEDVNKLIELEGRL